MSLVTKPPLLDKTGQQIRDILAVMASDNLRQNPDWPKIVDIVQKGLAPVMFNIGDQIIETYTDPDTNTQYTIPLDVVKFGTVYDEAGVEHDGMFLQCHYAMPLGVQFSNYQAFYYAENGLAAGTYYITWGNNWGSNVVNGKSYCFTLTAAVPAGGQLSGFEAAPDQAPSNWRVKSWASPSATTPLETVTVTEGTTGTFLGTISSSVKTAELNCMQSMGYGYNRWSQSAVEQYLNSQGTNWWSPKSNFDRRPDQYNKKAFLGGWSADFLNVLKKIKVQTSANTVVDSGVTDTTYDKFFLPSLEQIYVEPQASGVEGEYWPYWKERTGASSPQAQYGTYPERITYQIENHSQAQHVRLRSAYRGTTSGTWSVYSSGYVNYGYASLAYRFAPACVIF